jgi:type IV pilus assembly protein PilY1
MKTSLKVVGTTLLALTSVFAFGSSGINITQGPIITVGQAKPNVIFGMDDSASMDSEVLMNTDDGLIWYNAATPNGWSSGAWSFTGSQEMSYLFPNGCAPNAGGTSIGARTLCDNAAWYAVPPTTQFAAARSSDYNPLYYNPLVTYKPWSDAVVGGSTVTYANASPTAALSHPALAGSVTTNLQATINSTTANWTFNMQQGMVIPVGGRYFNNGAWNTVSGSAKTLTNGQTYTAAIPYWPASYWIKQACSTNGTTCVAAPDGATLQLYQIGCTATAVSTSSTTGCYTAGATYPGGRTQAAELQNFANWFQYYRKRRLMLAASMGTVLDSLHGMNLGVMAFSNRVVPTMYDTDSTTPAQNGQAVAGLFNTNAASLYSTPTRETLDAIGQAYMNKPAKIIKYACQRNAAFIVTDGFSDTTAVYPQANNTWDMTKYGTGTPYTSTTRGLLADSALYYYTTNLRTDITPTGRVPAATESLDPAADKNNNLHMNTYAITLGARGALWPANTNAYTMAPAPTWRSTIVSHSPDAIDDLWHATINGRGSMFLATTPSETATNIQQGLTQILRLSGSQSGVTYSTVNLRTGDSYAFAGSYKAIGWSGDVEKFTVDPTTGSLANTSSWSANTVLQGMDYTTRKLVTFSGGAGVSFNTTSTGQTTTLVNYLRGDRTNEGAMYRTRTGLMGAVINAEAAVNAKDGVVFATSNEGFVHTLDVATGQELWGYAPSFGLSTMAASSAPSWAFTTILDGTPVLGSAGGKKILVGGRGTAGVGYYALDVTNPKTDVTEADVAKRVLWEFPNSSTATTVTNTLGVSIGRPVVVHTKNWGDVVLVTSGYNTSGDGKGRLFVLDALTGAVQATIATTAGSSGSGDSGLGQVSAWQEADNSVQYVYGGDILGNLWRFDLVNSTVLNLATLTNKTGGALPITDAPELSSIGTRRMIFVGTGMLLGSSDLDDTKTYSFFGIWDKNSTTAVTRSQLATRSVTVNADGTRSVSGTSVNWTNQVGWVVDLPAGEKVNTDPAVAYGAIAFTANNASATGCTSNSALYLASTSDGLQLPDTAFMTTPYFGMAYSSTLSSQPAVARTSSGKIVLTVRQSDGTTNSRLLNLQGSVPAQKTAWREILR